MVGFLGGDGGIGSIISTMIFILFIFFYPRIMMWQMMFKLESNMKELAVYSKKAEELVVKKIDKKPKKQLKRSVHSFMDFFIVPPVNLDPYGIINKIEHVMDEGESRFEYFINQIAPKKDIETKADLVMGLKGALGTTQIYKIVRHYVITIKKTNNLQLAMILQMSMPMIMKIGKAQLKATKAFVDRVPIGDGIGPMIAASYKSKKGDEISKDVVMSKEKISGKNVFVLKSKGIGGRLGKMGTGVERIVRKHRIGQIITVDAGAKLEGERTGSIAEGVGIAMGGIGVARSKIEGVAIKNKLPIDAIVIKVSPVEASEPMKKEIYFSVERARKMIEKKIKESKEKNILIIGVGNTCGVGNDKKSLIGLNKKLAPIWRKQRIEMEKLKKKRRRFF